MSCSGSCGTYCSDIEGLDPERPLGAVSDGPKVARLSGAGIARVNLGTWLFPIPCDSTDKHRQHFLKHVHVCVISPWV